MLYGGLVNPTGSHVSCTDWCPHEPNNFHVGTKSSPMVLPLDPGFTLIWRSVFIRRINSLIAAGVSVRHTLYLPQGRSGNGHAVSTQQPASSGCNSSNYFYHIDIDNQGTLVRC